MLGTLLTLNWEIINKGKEIWPLGSKLILAKGNFDFEPVFLPAIAPDERFVLEAVVKTPLEENNFSGVWKIDTGRKVFGKLSAEFTTISDGKLREMVNMGFSIQKAKNALIESNWNMDLALSRVLQ
jgi:Ig-like domain from next to BRCA1 gene